MPAWLLNQSLAAKWLLRLYQKTSPWNWLPPLGRGERRLGSSARRRRRGVGGNQRNLPHLPHTQLVRRVIQRVVADVIVLYVDSVQRHVE